MSDVASTFKSAAQLNEVVSNLNICISMDQIEAVFSKHGISAPDDKKELLHRCMGVDEYFDSPHDCLSSEDEYSYAASVFLEGSWRLLVNG